MEELYNAVKNGKLSLKQFKEMLETVWNDGYDAHANKTLLSNWGYSRGGWSFNDELIREIIDLN